MSEKLPHCSILCPKDDSIGERTNAFERCHLGNRNQAARWRGARSAADAEAGGLSSYAAQGLRQSGRRALLTFKGPAARSRHKSREELEVKIGDAVRVATILEHLGFAPSFRYEKYRAEYEHDGGLAMLDETPAGVYIELEGAPEWIDRQAAALGFRPAEYITASYASLWIEHRRTHPSAPEHMVFPR
jgi:adenylate cyclase class IV